MNSRFIPRLCLLLGLCFSTAPSLVAQSERGYDDISVRSLNLRMMSERALRPPPSERKAQQALAELQEDFTRLQIINLGFVKSISAPRFDYKFVAKSASDINKRAGRLKNNLALPEPDEMKVELIEAATNELQMKKSMLRLGKLIYSFTHNPFFEEASVVDKSAVLAQRELDEIIKLSSQIKTDSETLRKQPVANNP